jgi:diaminopimelate epimerase
MKFTKMHGIGNDYVYVNLFETDVPDPAALAREVSPHRFAVGSDGLILVGPSEIADVSMRIFNADGSEAEMCGNGIRCVARFAYEHGLVERRPRLAVETRAGVKTVELTVNGGRVEKVRVNMGAPRLRRSEIPMSGPDDEKVVRETLDVGAEQVSITCVNMGNPHCVIFVPEVGVVPLERIGPKIECHAAFPERINVHYVHVIGPTEVRMRTWERGSGVTLACGTGAAAVCVAGHLGALTERSILAHLPGGDLELEWAEGGDVYMTGPATEVYTGEWPDGK